MAFENSAYFNNDKKNTCKYRYTELSNTDSFMISLLKNVLFYGICVLL